MILQKLQHIVDSKLSELSADMDISYPNIQFVPRVGVPFVMANLNYMKSDDESLNIQGGIHLQTYLDINLYSTLSTGTFEANRLSDLIAEKFARGSILTDGTNSMKVLKIKPRLQMQDNGYWRTLITVYFSTIY